MKKKLLAHITIISCSIYVPTVFGCSCCWFWLKETVPSTDVLCTQPDNLLGSNYFVENYLVFCSCHQWMNLWRNWHKYIAIQMHDLCILIPELFWGLGTGEDTGKTGSSSDNDPSSPADASLEVDTSQSNSWFFCFLCLTLLLCPCESTVAGNLSSTSVFKLDEISARGNIFLARILKD